MARIRSIHPGLFTDEAFISASMAARIMMMGLWTEADDNGIFEWKPVRYKMRIFPGDNVNAGELLDELQKLDVIMKFDVDGRSFGAVRNFCKWQRPKSPQEIYPITDEIRKYVRAVTPDEGGKPERGTALGRMLCEKQHGRCFYCETEITFYRKKPNSLQIDHKIPLSRGGSDDVENIVASCRQCNSLKANMTDVEFSEKFVPSELRERHLSRDAKENSQSPKTLSETAKTISQSPKSATREATFQMEDGGCKREEGKKERSFSNENETRASALVRPDDWPADYRERFWEAYPNKVGKPKALAKLDGVAKRGKTAWSDLMAGLDSYVRTKPPDRPWCNPETWINQERWNDNPADVAHQQAQKPPATNWRDDPIYRNVL